MFIIQHNQWPRELVIYYKNIGTIIVTYYSWLWSSFITTESSEFAVCQEHTAKPQIHTAKPFIARTAKVFVVCIHYYKNDL